MGFETQKVMINSNAVFQEALETSCRKAYVSLARYRFGVDLMPQIVKCANCGYVLYKGNDLVPPKDIVKKFNGKCPKCMAPLNQNPLSIEVRGQKRFW